MVAVYDRYFYCDSFRYAVVRGSPHCSCHPVRVARFVCGSELINLRLEGAWINFRKEPLCARKIHAALKGSLYADGVTSLSLVNRR